MSTSAYLKFPEVYTRVRKFVNANPKLNSAMHWLRSVQVVAQSINFASQLQVGRQHMVTGLASHFQLLFFAVRVAIDYACGEPKMEGYITYLLL